MARNGSVDSMNYAELSELEARIGKLKMEKQSTERAELKAKLAAIAKEAGFTLEELFAKDGRRRGKGTVAIKYRDPKNPSNTWTGRGRQPRWLTAALKTRGVKKDDFLI
jgi:DNA-binding protein H-NS